MIRITKHELEQHKNNPWFEIEPYGDKPEGAPQDIEVCTVWMPVSRFSKKFWAQVLVEHMRTNCSPLSDHPYPPEDQLLTGGCYDQVAVDAICRFMADDGTELHDHTIRLDAFTPKALAIMAHDCFVWIELPRSDSTVRALSGSSTTEHLHGLSWVVCQEIACRQIWEKAHARA